MPSRLRFTAAAAQALREGIARAATAAGERPEPVEVFAIGDVEEGEVVGVTITCRGRGDRVLALVDRPRAGQVVIHNHPSGDLRPSEADLRLAHRYGEDGVGFVIVDDAVQRSNFVVEPHAPRAAPVDDEALERFFTEGLPRALPGWEARPQQLEMARRVARCLERDEPVLIEAGTGTGKSLAYLVPAALWARANEAKVAISTYTRSLQAQLLHADLPLLRAGGLDATWAVLQGRNNYLCRRRLALADAEEEGDNRPAELDALLGWARTAADGIRADLPFSVDGALWERVMSDADLTLSTRCPHYDRCFFYQARRRAAAADLVVVNHALLMADRILVDQLGRGVLPRVRRVVVDEAHHLEEAATGAGAHRLTALAVRRAALPLLDARRRKGALSRTARALGDDRGPLSPDDRAELHTRCAVAASSVEALAGVVEHLCGQIADRALDADGAPRRITPELCDTELWRLEIAPDVHRLSHELVQATEHIDAVLELFAEVRVPEDRAQPLLDLRRAHRRLTEHARIAADFLEYRDDLARWVELARGRRGDRSAAICAAPIDVGPLLERVLWRPLPGTACTSATLAVNRSFTYWKRRHGLAEVDTEVIPSPFDHARQAILGLPRDIPPPDDPGYAARATEVAAEAVAISDGGAFVLCTSYAAVSAFARALRGRADGRPILAQGEAGRTALLQRFMDNPRAVLVGTDSFWEGVSVRGQGLRLVIIPRLPFRVPTDPLRQARHERVRQQGLDPFLAYSLPEAVIKLRQGYGRLIRSRSDRGAVLILDRRIHDRRYGQVMLRALPPARRVKAPWPIVAAQLRHLYAAIGP